jgi:hypothetical protein
MSGDSNAQYHEARVEFYSNKVQCLHRVWRIVQAMVIMTEMGSSAYITTCFCAKTINMEATPIPSPSCSK